MIDLGGWDLLLEGAPIREWANRDALTPDPALQHLAGAVEAEMVGDHEAGDHGLAQAPTRFDQALIGAGDRVLGEHDPGDIWPKECLNDDADTRPSKQTDTLAVGNGRVSLQATSPPGLHREHRLPNERPPEAIKALTHGAGSYRGVGEGGSLTLDVSPDMLRKQLTVIGSSTFSSGLQADCARFVVDRKLAIDDLFSHRWKFEEAREAYRVMSGKGFFDVMRSSCCSPPISAGARA